MKISIAFLWLFIILQSCSDETPPPIVAYDPGITFPVKPKKTFDTTGASKLKMKVRIKKDEFSGHEWYFHKTSPTYNSVTAIVLYFSKSDEKASNLRLKLSYAADDWLFIKKYDFMVDNEHFVVMPDEIKRDNSGGKIWEWSDVPYTDWPRVIEAMATASSVKIRFAG